MKIWVMCLIIQLLFSGIEALNLRMESELGGIFKKHKNKAKEQKKKERKLKKKLKKQYKKNLKNELKRLKDEELMDQGDYEVNRGRFHSKRDYEDTDYGSHKNVHEVSDDVLNKLEKRLEHNIIDDVERFVKAVGAY